MRVRRRARAHHAQHLVARVPQLVARARRDHRAVAGADLALLVADAQPADPVRHEVQLLAEAMEVLGRRGAGRQRRLREALVGGRRGGAPGPLADLGAVLRGEGIDVVVAGDVHGEMVTVTAQALTAGSTVVAASSICSGSSPSGQRYT